MAGGDGPNYSAPRPASPLDTGFNAGSQGLVAMGEKLAQEEARSTKELAAFLAQLAVDHGLTRVEWDDGRLIIERPAPLPAEPKRPESVESEFERIAKMDPDARDRLLQLRKLGQ